MQDGMYLDLDTLPPNLAMRADPSPPVVGSVAFQLDGAAVRVESISPYSLSTGNPALIARIDRLNRARSAASADGKLPPAERGASSTTVRDDGQQTATPTIADTPLNRVRPE